MRLPVRGQSQAREIVNEQTPSPRRPLRLALYGLSGLPGQLIDHLVGGQDGVEVVARLEPSGDLAADFARSGAEMLICAIEPGEMSRLWRDATVARPSLAVLNLLDDMRGGRLYALVPEESELKSVDTVAIVDAARARRT